MGQPYNSIILLLFTIVLGALANAIRHKMEIRGIIMKKKQNCHYLKMMWLYT